MQWPIALVSDGWLPPRLLPPPLLLPLLPPLLLLLSPPLLPLLPPLLLPPLLLLPAGAPMHPACCGRTAAARSLRSEGSNCIRPRVCRGVHRKHDAIILVWHS
jgi:hypothetical protein